MKALIGSLAGVALLATSAFAQTSNTTAWTGSKMPTKTMKTCPAAKEGTPAEEAKESRATEAKEKAAARHQRHHAKHHAKIMMHKKSMTKNATTTTMS